MQEKQEHHERYKSERYVVGTHPIPEWCWHGIMMYRRDDGTMGYEFTIQHARGHTTTLYLKKGDVLLKNGTLVRLIPKKEESKNNGA